LHLTLLLPDLIWPRDASGEAGVRLPGLTRLLAGCERFDICEHGLEGLLCEQFGIATQHDAAAAPILAGAEGADPGPHYWLCADPVCLDAGRAALTLIATPQCAAAEAQALLATLNRHFAQDGAEFVAPDPAHVPTHWYLRSATVRDVATSPCSEVLGRAIYEFMPRGRDAATLLSWMNEAQMLLHEHPVNLEREARGERVINGVWLWGGGCAHPAPQPRFDHAWGDDRLLRALALHSRVPHEIAAPGADAVLRSERAVLLLRRTGDEWESLARLDETWLRPLVSAARDGRIAGLDLGFSGAFDTLHAWRAARFRAPRKTLLDLVRRQPDLAAQLARVRDTP
jgi:hypothetical protein